LIALNGNRFREQACTTNFSRPRAKIAETPGSDRAIRFFRGFPFDLGLAAILFARIRVSA
jgi:hypothetical protein